MIPIWYNKEGSLEKESQDEWGLHEEWSEAVSTWDEE